MGWVVRAGLAAGIYLALAGPGFAQTNEACVLRCIDRGNLDQTCEARCSKGVPPANPPAANRTSEPAQQSAPSLPATQSAPPPAVQATPPVTSGPSGSQPATPRSAPALAPAQAAPSSPAAQSAPQPTAAQSAPAVAPAQSAPQPTAAQSAPQQSVKPPEPPVNQRCVLLCLDHGHLDQYCDRVCALPMPGASPAAPASK